MTKRSMSSSIVPFIRAEHRSDAEQRRIGARLGGFMLAAVIAAALMLSPAARRSAGTLSDGLGLARLTPESLAAAFARPIEVPRVDSAHNLSELLTAAGYHLDRVRTGAAEVPRLLVLGLPGDLKSLESIDSRKAVFIKAMLPLILQVNEDLAADRARVLDLRDRQAAGQPVAARDQAWLADMYAAYAVRIGNSDELLRRLDAVPVSLALAQAAIESGWGTSRFAQEGNALFGQIAQQGGADGLKSTADGTMFRSFDTLMGAVQSYARNLNTHTAYRDFRAERAKVRRKVGEGAPLEGLKLVGALIPYSERGLPYLEDIRVVIRNNRLEQFDRSRLAGGSAVESRADASARAPNA
ncbi:MAG: glucosaminidase domain-containing protein [Gemmatimonas sp.]